MATLNATNLKHASSSSNNIVLASDGSVNIPTLTTNSSFGKIAQVKAAFKTDVSSHTGTSFGAVSGLSVSLAKTKASNKLLLMADINAGRDGTINILFKMYQDGSEITALNNSGSGSNLCFMHWVSVNSNGNHGAGDNPNMNGAALWDGPNDTSSHTYQLYQAAESSGRVVYVNRRGGGTGNCGTSCLTIFEVEP